ncbi:MAG: methionine--tRNA ligase subunit beta, partial [Helicobacteraceae bacterium]|nr:methionine--tRNA ligase subunit beta [Helicobacteraceae bacterium]
RYFDNAIAIGEPKLFEEERAQVDEIVASVDRLFDTLQLNRYLEEIWRLFAIGNKLINDFKPWQKMKDNRGEAVKELLAFIGNVLAKGALLLAPIMPKKCGAIGAAIGISIDETTRKSMIESGEWLTAFTLRESEQLFERVESPKMPETPAAEPSAIDKSAQETAPFITIEDFGKVEIVVGTVIAATAIEKSAKLLQLQVDLGEGKPRQIVSGIREFYAPEALIGAQVCVVANLKPIKLMGIDSFGMILAAKDANGLKLIRPQDYAADGTRVK